MSHATMSSAKITVGLDLGDRYSQFCMLDADSGVIEEGRFRTTATALRRVVADRERMRIVIEVGTHSPWVSRLLESCGHEVLVADARKVRLIYANDNKNDQIDAETLARIGHLDPKLLSPIRHRGAEISGRSDRVIAWCVRVASSSTTFASRQGGWWTPAEQFSAGVPAQSGRAHPGRTRYGLESTTRNDRHPEP